MDSQKTYRASTGYVYELARDHPRADLHGRVLQHRLVMERSLGRFLDDAEVVHHRNRVREDNRLANLELHSSNSAHLRSNRKRDDPKLIRLIHRAARDPNVRVADLPASPVLVRWICVKHNIHWLGADKTHLTEARVRKIARIHPKIPQAAIALGVSAAHLYLNYQHLFEMRKRPYFLDTHRVEICKSAMTERAVVIAARYQTTKTTVYQALERWSTNGALPTALAARLNRHRGRKNLL